MLGSTGNVKLSNEAICVVGKKRGTEFEQE